MISKSIGKTYHVANLSPRRVRRTLKLSCVHAEGVNVGWSALLGICLPLLFHQADQIAVGVTKETDP